MDLEKYYNAETESSVRSNYCSGSTHRPPIEYHCRSYTGYIGVIPLVVLMFTLDIVLVEILEIS